MSTINRDIALVLLRNDGWYPGDPQVLSVYRYTNDWGNVAYRFSPHERDEASFLRSEFIHEPVLLWDRAGGLTQEGRDELKPQSEHTRGDSNG